MDNNNNERFGGSLMEMASDGAHGSEQEHQAGNGQQQYWPCPASHQSAAGPRLYASGSEHWVQSLRLKSRYWLGTFIYSTCNDKKFIICTHIDFTQDDINNAADDDNEVKDVPGVSKVALHREIKRYCSKTTLDWVDEHVKINDQSLYPRFEGHELENHLHSEEHGEDQVQHVWQLGHMVRLVAVLFKVESEY